MATINNKPAAEWTNEQLIEWARGNLKTGGSSSIRTVAAEAVKRFGLEASEDAQFVKDQILAEQGTGESETPETTQPAEAPTPEAKPAPTVPLSGAGTATTTEAAKPAPAPAPQPKVAAPDQPLAQKPAAAKPTTPEKKPLNRVIIEQALADYAEAMQPGKPVNATEGAAAQVQLFRAMQNVLRQEGSEFTACFSTLLSFVNAHRKGVFNERYAFRFLDQVKLSAPERKNFERFLNLLLTTADPATRHITTRQVDLTATMAGFTDTNVQQRVIDFYAV